MKNFTKLLLLLFLSSLVQAQSDAVHVRVADVGAGLGTVVRMPHNKVMVYDAGRDNRLLPVLRELVPDKHIDLLILSHNDADHIGGVPAIEKEFTVGTVYYSPYRETKSGDLGATYTHAMAAIQKMKDKGTEVIAVSNTSPAPGHVLYKANAVSVTYLCGFSDPNAQWVFKKGDRPSKPNNAISLMVRLDYGESSMIFGGDAVGRIKGSACAYTEKYLLSTLSEAQLQADVLLSPHHGAENGDCADFIKAVQPEYVVFSAGSMYGHPRNETAHLYLENGVKSENMFRTDRGDHEKGKYANLEWDYGRVNNCIDQAGDDDVEITLHKSKIEVVYVQPEACECKPRD